MTRVSRVVLAVILAAAQAAAASGQTTSASIRGNVHDAQGAPVTTASVTVTGRARGWSRTATTAADGTFVVPNLPPGAVDVTVTAPGFDGASRENVVLEVAQTATIDI